jgi:hypothetical protein
MAAPLPALRTALSAAPTASPARSYYEGCAYGGVNRCVCVYECVRALDAPALQLILPRARVRVCAHIYAYLCAQGCVHTVSCSPRNSLMSLSVCQTRRVRVCMLARVGMCASMSWLILRYVMLCYVM